MRFLAAAVLACLILWVSAIINIHLPVGWFQ